MGVQTKLKQLTTKKQDSEQHLRQVNEEIGKLHTSLQDIQHVTDQIQAARQVIMLSADC